MPILTAEERVGQLVGDRYRLNEVLSVGGMGVLFDALDEAAGERVAVKMLKPDHSLDPDRVARFLRETKIAARLRHPNVARVLEVGIDQSGVSFLAMELLHGRSLEAELAERGVLPVDDALAFVLPIADVLANAHAAGIVHRDVKPANIFLSRSDKGEIVPKLLDFGIAKPLEDEFETQSGLIVGTPGYMAPEQARRGECGPSTDIWAIGAVLYRCLAGQSPHAGGSVMEVLVKLVKEPVPTLAAPGVNKPLCATIDRALAQDPERRYPSMTAFIRALKSAARVEFEGSTEILPAEALAAAEAASVASAAFAAPESNSTEPLAVAPPTQPRPRVRHRAFAIAVVASLAGALFIAWLSVSGTGQRAAAGRADEQPAVPSEPVVTKSASRKVEPNPALALAPELAEEARLPAPGRRPASSTAQAQLSSSSRRAKRAASALSAPAQARTRPVEAAPAARKSEERERTTGLPVATEW